MQLHRNWQKLRRNRIFLMRARNIAPAQYSTSYSLFTGPYTTNATMYNKTILITGVAGFIGSHLADWMLESGYHVIGLDNLSTGRLSNLACRSNAAFSFIECSVEDFDLNGLPAAVFHLAAQTSVPVSINSFISSSRQTYDQLYELLIFVEVDDTVYLCELIRNLR